MPDLATQFDSSFPNYFMQLFDDIFSTREEKLVPLSTIKRGRTTKERRDERLKLAEALKDKDMEKTKRKLNEERAKTEVCQYIKLAKEVYEGWESLAAVDKTIEKLQNKKRAVKAHFPLDVHIPNFNLKRTMYEWGMGGPTSRQYTLFSVVINIPRKVALRFYLGMISAYVSFRESSDRFVGDDDVRLLSLKKYMFNKVEEDIVVDLFFPKAQVDPNNDEVNYAEGPSLGSIFLELKSLTGHNNIFHEFVDKTMQLDSQVRQRLASKYLYDRMIQLSAKFVRTHELKYNYIRVAWERKLKFMDDYIICLILFIKDKVANLTWEQVEDVLYPKAKIVLRECYEVSRKAAIEEFNNRFDTPIEYFC
uniref:Cas9_REC domain-containing protein n=1 Tax=Caenorhabditis tropicalis TaxID=1561998 RepID=A0A1I7TJ73_9PELO